MMPLAVFCSSFFSSFCTLMVRMSPSTFSLRLISAFGQRFGQCAGAGGVKHAIMGNLAAYCSPTPLPYRGLSAACLWRDNSAAKEHMCRPHARGLGAAWSARRALDVGLLDAWDVGEHLDRLLLLQAARRLVMSQHRTGWQARTRGFGACADAHAADSKVKHS